MAYKQSIYKSVNCIEYGYCFKGNYGAKGEKRAARKKATPEQIKRQNQKNKENLLRRTIQLNFYPNDYWVCLKYPKGTRKEYADVKKDFNKFLRGLRKDYKTRGEELKFVYRIEIGKRGGIHIHILVNRIWGTDLLVNKNWVNDLIHFTMLREEGGYSKLASYIAKPLPDEPEQMSFLNEADIKAMSKYGTSRNLVRPEPETKEYRRKTVRKLIQDGPKATQGFFIDKESIRTGVNEYTGYSYLYYTELRIAPVQRVIKIPESEAKRTEETKVSDEIKTPVEISAEDKKMEVNIYIQTDAKGPARRKEMHGIYLIECMVGDKPYTVHKTVTCEGMSENQLTLKLMAAALKRMTKASVITLHIQSKHVLNAINNQWHLKWQQNKWRNSGNTEVKNAGLWQEITELLSPHIYTACDEQHSYSTWMTTELRKLKE